MENKQASDIFVTNLVGPPDDTNYLCTYICEKQEPLVKWSFSVILCNANEDKFWNLTKDKNSLQDLVNTSSAKDETEYLNIIKNGVSFGDVSVSRQCSVGGDDDSLQVTVGGGDGLLLVLPRRDSVPVTDMYNVCARAISDRRKLEQRLAAANKRLNQLEQDASDRDRCSLAQQRENDRASAKNSPAKVVIRQPGMSLINPSVKKTTVKEKGVHYDE